MIVVHKDLDKIIENNSHSIFGGKEDAGKKKDRNEGVKRKIDMDKEDIENNSHSILGGERRRYRGKKRQK
jgi:hypothetical protein